MSSKQRWHNFFPKVSQSLFQGSELPSPQDTDPGNDYDPYAGYDPHQARENEESHFSRSYDHSLFDALFSPGLTFPAGDHQVLVEVTAREGTTAIVDRP